MGKDVQSSRVCRSQGTKLASKIGIQLLWSIVGVGMICNHLVSMLGFIIRCLNKDGIRCLSRCSLGVPVCGVASSVTSERHPCGVGNLLNVSHNELELRLCVCARCVIAAASIQYNVVVLLNFHLGAGFGGVF